MPKRNYLQSISANPNPLKAGSLKMVDPLTANIAGTFGNAGATTAAPTPTPPASPAKSSYIQSLAGTDPALNASASFGSPSVTTPQMPSTPKIDPNAAYRGAFDEYIKSLKPSSKEESANKHLANLTLQSKRDYEEALQKGETMGFATGEAARVNRNNAFGIEAASSAVDAFTRGRSAMTEAQKARLDFEKTLIPKPEEAFTLGKDQVRYDSAGNVVARGQASSPTGGSYVAGQDPTADAWVQLVQSGKAKIDNVPEEYRGAVAQGLASAPEGDDPKKQYVKSQADEALTNIDTALGLLTGETSGKFNTAGTAFGRAINQFVPGSDVANLNSALDTVKALVGFDALQKMRESSPTGGALGQITERELAFLQSVQGSLNTNQGTEQLVATINRIRQSFQTLQIVNSPDGSVFELDGQKYQKQGNQMIPVAFNGVGGDTKQASKGNGVILGYDINSYATDPNHEKRIATIVNKIPQINSPMQADAYIKQVAPRSPVTGLDVLAASSTYGVPPALILAIMQQDSSFGTAGKAIRTKNPGNVGNTDSGAERIYPSWRDGVFAVAKNLSQRRV